MYVLYVLYSKGANKIYIGYTSNLVERFRSHNSLGKKGYTIKHRPWVVVFTETYNNKQQARNRENFYKSEVGRKLICNKIKSLGLISA